MRPSIGIRSVAGRTALLLAMVAVAGCGGTQFGQTPDRAEAQRMTELDIPSLWAIQASTADQQELARAEAELGSRGQLVAGDAYLGRRTLSAAGRARYRRGRVDPEMDILNCDDFLTAAAAQVEFLGSSGPRQDQHRLDPDGDGLACNWADTLREAVAQARA